MNRAFENNIFATQCEDRKLNGLSMKIVVMNGTLTSDEQRCYVEYIQRMYPGIEPDEIWLDCSGDKIQYRVAVGRCVLAKQGGAVIGDPAMWNDAKRAEYAETIPNAVYSDLLY